MTAKSTVRIGRHRVTAEGRDVRLTVTSEPLAPATLPVAIAVVVIVLAALAAYLLHGTSLT